MSKRDRSNDVNDAPAAKHLKQNEADLDTVPLSRLAAVELQSIMRMCCAEDLISLAKCASYFFEIASCDFAWACIPVLNASDTLMTPKSLFKFVPMKEKSSELTNVSGARTIVLDYHLGSLSHLSNRATLNARFSALRQVEAFSNDDQGTRSSNALSILSTLPHVT
jgi:hypothetical protein